MKEYTVKLIKYFADKEHEQLCNCRRAYKKYCYSMGCDAAIDNTQDRISEIIWKFGFSAQENRVEVVEKK